jgi:hypothetical protein
MGNVYFISSMVHIFRCQKIYIKSWKENFEQVYPSLSTFDKEIIKKINILHVCKESKDADRLM